MRRWVLIFLTVASSALAQQPAPSQPVDMTIILRTEKGDPIKDPTDRTDDDKTCEKCRSFTLGRAIATALNGVYEDEKGLTFQQRFDRASLANRIRDSKDATLTASEVALIERLIAKAGFIPLMIYQIAPLIDPNMKAGAVQ